MPKSLSCAFTFLLFLSLSACGDDDPQSKDAGPVGERCVSPGLTQTDCTCATSSVPGYRQCQDNKIWGQCICPSDLPDGVFCRDGQRYLCDPCTDAGEQRVVACMNGQVDCSCGTDGGIDANAPLDDASALDDGGA